MARQYTSTSRLQQRAWASLRRSLRDFEIDHRRYYEALTGDRQFRANPTRGVNARNPRITVNAALISAARLIRDRIKMLAPVFGDQGKTWSPDDGFPKFWQWTYVYTSSTRTYRPKQRPNAWGHSGASKRRNALKRLQESHGLLRNKGNVIYYPGTRRPHGRIKSNVNSKMSKLSTVSERRVVTYVRFKRSVNMWNRGNAWYAKFTEYGTSAGVRGYPTKARPYFKLGERIGLPAAEKRVADFLRTWNAAYKSKRPGNPNAGGAGGGSHP